MHIDDAAFAREASAASTSGAPLRLRGRTLTLAEPYKLAAPREELAVVGPGQIVGRGHSLFRVAGRQRLSLEGLELRHECSSADRREVGAAVFALGRARAELRDCALSSEHGFGVWLVQRARAELRGCAVGPCGRSGVVCFGDARLDAVGTTVRGAAPHGVCARGRARIALCECALDACGSRGAYAYHNATLELVACTISRTRDPAAAAIEADSRRVDDRARLVVRECKFDGNAGARMRVRGSVDADVDGARNMCDLVRAPPRRSQERVFPTGRVLICGCPHPPPSDLGHPCENP